MSEKDKQLVKELKRLLEGVDPIKVICLLNEEVLPKNVILTIEILPTPHK